MISLSESLGWFGTSLQAASFLFRNQRTLRLFQAFAAFIWLSYGVLIEAQPVVVANIIVLSLALFSIWRDRKPNSAPFPKPETV